MTGKVVLDSINCRLLRKDLLCSNSGYRVVSFATMVRRKLVSLYSRYHSMTIHTRLYQDFISRGELPIFKIRKRREKIVKIPVSKIPAPSGQDLQPDSAGLTSHRLRQTTLSILSSLIQLWIPKRKNISAARRVSRFGVGLIVRCIRARESAGARLQTCEAEFRLGSLLIWYDWG